MIEGQSRVELSDFGHLNGWSSADLTTPLATFKRSAAEILSTAHGFNRTSTYSGARDDWLPTSTAALEAEDARKFFETHFLPFKIADKNRPQGLFTGYYEPLARGSRTRTERFNVPIYCRPPGLISFSSDVESKIGFRYGHIIDGKPAPFFTRLQIECGALDGQDLEICWLESWADAFFIHIQGSGRIVMDDGKSIRLAFSAKNGHPYLSIGTTLLDMGYGSPEMMSMQFIRNWIEQNPKEFRELLWRNNSYIFFREVLVEDPSLGAPGAAQVNLTPLCSLAIDRRYWMFGTPFWLETSTPPEAPGGTKPFRNLMIGQDTGTAIRGPLRGDIYWGWGDNAIANAGHMKGTGRMTALLPILVARRLGY